jgi:type II secretory pathway pseudopilin PulG
MIEMLGVLAIVGILSAGGIAGYSMAMQSYKTNALIEKIQLISTRIRTVYKNGNYSGISKENLVASGKLSDEDFKNPFGGDFSIDMSSYASGGTGFTIKALNIPAEACVDMLTMEWSAVTSIQLYSGTTIHQIGSFGPSISANYAVNHCKGKDGILFWFR